MTSFPHTHLHSATSVRFGHTIAAVTSRLRVVILACVGWGLLSACATTQTTPVQNTPVTQAPTQTQPVKPVEPVKDVVRRPEPRAEVKAPEVRTRDGVTPPHMRGRDVTRLALLLPLSASSERLRSEANSMLKSAELSVFNRDKADVILLAFDTRGTETGASTATQAALRSGADVILGPVLARSVIAAGRAAKSSQTPVIAFSTDQQVAGDGTYLLSFPPEADVKRIVEYVASTGAKRFAFLGPQSAYGQRVLAEYRRSVGRVDGEITGSETYRGNDITVMQGPAKALADAFKRREAVTGGNGRMAFEAIMLPEGGTPLRSLAPLLPYYDIDPSDVQFMGTGLWFRDEVVREPALSGGIFAGPDQEGLRQFKSQYSEQFNEDPSRLASLAYDAVNIGAYVANGRASGRHARALSSEGFYGVDGLVRFNRNGTPDRSLAVYQIRNGQFNIIDPAPRSFTGPS